MKKIVGGMVVALLLALSGGALAQEADISGPLDMEGIERTCIVGENCSISIFPSEDGQARVFSNYAEGDCALSARVEDATLYLEARGTMGEERVTGAVSLELPADTDLEIALDDCGLGAGSFDSWLQGDVTLRADGGGLIEIAVPADYAGKFRLEMPDRGYARLHVHEDLANYTLTVDKRSARSTLTAYGEQFLFKETGTISKMQGDGEAADIYASLDGNATVQLILREKYIPDEE